MAIQTGKCSILCIDDDPYFLDSLHRLLNHKGFQVHHTPWSETSFDLAEKLKPNLVLVDLSMPSVSGLEVCRLLKQNPETSHIPVVVLSGYDDSETIVQAIQNGASEFISKPFEPDEFIKKIRKYLPG